MLSQLTVGLISTQKDIVEQSYENYVFSETNRQLNQRLDKLVVDVALNKESHLALSQSMQKHHEYTERQRLEMDVMLTAFLIQTQTQTLEQEHELMELREFLRMKENVDE